jgi:hypothetical protein
VAVIEELGNPFEEESQDLLVLDTKEIQMLLWWRQYAMSRTKLMLSSKSTPFIATRFHCFQQIYIYILAGYPKESTN